MGLLVLVGVGGAVGCGVDQRSETSDDPHGDIGAGNSTSMGGSPMEGVGGQPGELPTEPAPFTSPPPQDLGANRLKDGWEHTTLIDGAKTWSTDRAYDDALETHCSIVELLGPVHGFTHACLPQTSGSILFENETCDEPFLAYTVGECAGPGPRAGQITRGFTAEGTPSYFELGSSIYIPDPFELVSEECDLVGAYGGAWAAPILPTDISVYVHGTIEERSVAESLDLTVDVFLGHDGSEVAVSLSRNGERCFLFETQEGYLCLDQRPLSADSMAFSDASCESSDVVLSRSAPHPILLVLPGATDPPALSDVRVVGPEVAMAFHGSSEACLPSSKDPGQKWFEVGPVVDIDTYPLLVPTSSGSGRLRRPVIEVDDLEVLVGGSLWDAEFSVECVRQGGLCTPDTGNLGDLEFWSDEASYFSDESCETPLVVIDRSPAPDVIFASDAEQNTCFDLWGTYQAEKYSGPLYRIDGVDCVETDLPPDATSYSWWVEIPPEDLIVF